MITYIDNIKKVLDDIKVKDLYDVADIIMKSNTVYVFGNGGSCATADHFIVDLLKYANKRAFSLSSMSLLTMISNDYGYDNSFRWVIQKVCSPGDVFIGISTSGKSENVLKALLCDIGVKTVLITGECNIEASQYADKHVVIPSCNTQIIEDVSLIVCHMIAIEIKKMGEANVGNDKFSQLC